MLARLFIAAAVTALAAPATAITIGANDGANCWPFACGPSDGLTNYQQTYRAGAFAGPTAFNQISFGGTSDNLMDGATYRIAFYLQLGSDHRVLDISSPAANWGTLLGNFGTFVVSGAMQPVLKLKGSVINYNPSDGNLLMDVEIVDVIDTSSDHRSFFYADRRGASSDVYRAYFSSLYGSGADGLSPLQTTFSLVPEPASWAMLIAGFGLVGAVARRSRSAVTA